MIIALAFILILLSSSLLFRGRKQVNSAQLSLDPPPQILVQPACTNEVRRFMDGQVSLLKVQQDGVLMLDQRGELKTAKEQCFLLKSSEPLQFRSTLLSSGSDGKILVHASLRDESKVIIFRA